MASAAAWDLAKPLDSALFKAKSKKEPAGLKFFKPVFQLISESTAAAIQELNTAMVQCTVSAESLKTFVPDDIEGDRFQYKTDSGHLRFWITADQDFSRLICELAFGGAGVEASEDEASRPATKIEKQVRSSVFRTIAARLVQTLEKTFDISLQEEEVVIEKPLVPSTIKESFIDLELLVNAFSMGSEVTVHFMQDDLIRLAPEQSGMVAEKPFDALAALQQCQFELQTLFPPENIALDILLRLQPGSVLPLSISPETQVIVKCGSETIFDGTFKVHQQKIEVQLQEMNGEEMKDDDHLAMMDMAAA